MTVMEKKPPRPARGAPAAEVAALRGALRLETRLAEALACRSRSLIEAVDALARRALDGASDIDEARVRLDRLSRGMRQALEAGETSWPIGLARLAERSLAVFGTDEAPRIAWGGPSVGLSSEASRLVGLTLFELGSRSLRHGALSLPEGRAELAWTLEADGSLRIAWREHGAPREGADLRSGVGGALLPLLSERFGAPLAVRANSFGLRAELVVPAQDVTPAPLRLFRTDRVPADPHLTDQASTCAPSISASGSRDGRSST